MLACGCLREWQARAAPGQNLHLRVEDAGGPLDDGDGLVVGGDGEDGVLGVPQDSDKLQAEILGV